MTQPNPIRLALIGCGHHATWTLYPCFQFFDFQRVDPVAVCDLDQTLAQQTARRFGLGKAFADFKMMLDEVQPDAIVACVAPIVHEQIIAEAIARRIPLLVEKPPARNSALLIPLAQQADEQGASVMVAFMRRFGALTQWAKQAMGDGAFGDVMMLHGREGIWGCPPEHMVLDSGIHLLDLVRHLGLSHGAGDVQSVFAVQHSDQQSRTGVAVTLRFAQGPIASVTLSSLESFSYPNNVLEVHGSRGGFIRIDNWCKGTWHRDGATFCSPPNPAEASHSSLTYEQPWNAANVNRSAAMQGYVAELEHFISHVEQHTRPEPNLWDGVRALELVEAVQQSIVTKKEVALSR